MPQHDNLLSFTAIRGIQAGREYFTIMCPLKVIPRIFVFDEEELPAELRSQRVLNRTRIPEISNYLSENPRSYIFSSITASIDGEAHFEPFSEAGPASNAGKLLIPMDAKFLINDGQHRRAAIGEALKSTPELGDESLSIVLFRDAGLKRSQQMFADLNRHSIRPTTSIGILYDKRDPLSQLTCKLVEEVSIFKNMVETEKTSVPKQSNRLFTLSGIHQATRTLLNKPKKSKISKKEADLSIHFWEAVGEAIPDWKLASQKKASCSELRRDYIHAHGVAIQAIGVLGSALLSENTRGWKSQISGLKNIDWSRTNSEQWEGRALVNGRVSKAHANIILTANVLKTQLGLSLGAKEMQLENECQTKLKAA